MKPETRYAKSGDVYIAYQITGDGPFTMLWSPGWVSHLDLTWDNPRSKAIVDAMSASWRLIRYDKRGTGLSDRPSGPMTLEQWVEDLAAVMDAAGVERAVQFGGSKGASTATMFAATYPERTQALVAYGAMSRWIKSEDHPWGLTLERQQEIVQDILEKWPSDEYILESRFGIGSEPTAEAIERTKRYLQTAASPSAAAAHESMNMLIDTGPILDAVRVPTLILNRLEDPIAPIEGARALAARIANSKMIEYRGTGHGISDIASQVVSDIFEFVTGSRPRLIEDRFLATVLFIDIVDSTSLLESMGDAEWRRRLETYYHLVRAELTAYQGKETHTAGDGIMAVFGGPAQAVRCAQNIVARVKSMGIDVRAGVHIGEVESMGDNIGGIAVHIAARIQGEAKAGQVAVSEVVTNLVQGSELRFESVGERNLKGIEAPVRIWTAC